MIICYSNGEVPAIQLSGMTLAASPSIEQCYTQHKHDIHDYIWFQGNPQTHDYVKQTSVLTIIPIPIMSR